MTAIESTAAQPATSNINNTTISSSSPKQSISDETGRTPEEFTQLGLWEVEPLYYSLSSSKNSGGGGGGYTTSGESGRKKRGKAFKSRAEGEYKCFEAHDGAVYRPGDHVFVEISQTEPYVIGSINMFKMAKRDQLSIKITRYYRPDDVPEISYSLIIQERKEQGHYETTRELQVRELFSSETTTVHPISALRGKCSVKVVKDIRSVAETDLKEPDSFFSCLNFNLESSRLASVQGEIRVGPSHQAKVPQLPSSSISDEPDRDELLYRPGQLCEETEQHYVRMARTFRTFALMKNDRITSLEKNARTGDLVMDDAIVTLHRCGYNTSEAISVMNSSDQLLSTDSSFMSADDVKKFGKGIKTHGKNFFKINREILPYHPREQLVSFYYLWKKSSEATRPKPLARTRAVVANTGKRGGRTGVNATVRNSRPESTELVDYASASETDTEQMEQDGRPNYACHHCYSSKSRDWHHAGKDRQLMCTDCRLFYKKYGQLRPVDRPSTVPPCLFKSARNSPSGSLNGEIEEETGVKTRATKFKERKRTPSVADMLDRTPSKLTDSDGFTPEKRSTPLRNAAKSRKRNFNKTSEENTPAKRRLKTEPTTPEESPAKSEGQPTKQEDVKPSTSAPSSPVKPSTSPQRLSNGVLPISVSAPHLSSKKPIAKVEPLDTSGYNHEEKMQIDEKPSTSTAHSPVEKENQPIKEEILEELDKKQSVDEDEGDFSEAFEKEDQETREISDDRKYSKSTHQYINIENDTDAQGREKLKVLEKVPGYHLVQTVKFKSVRTCARTYLSYTPEEPEFWKKRKERKEEKKQQQQQQQLNNLNKPQQQQPSQNPVAILPNPNLARPAQVTAPGNLLQKTPTQELPQNPDINNTLQAAFMNQLHAQSRIPMSSAQMLPPPGTPIPGFQPMPSMSPFDPRYALGGFPNNQMQMMMMWQQQMEQQKQAEALRHHQLNGMLNGNHAQNTQANSVNANKPNPPTNVVSPMDQQRLAALSLFSQNPSSFQNPLAALAAMQNDQQQQQLAASHTLAILNERAAQQHQQRSIQDRIQMELLQQQQQQQQNQAQQQQQNHMQHPTPNQPATAALAAVAQQAQQTQQSQQNQQQQHLLNGSIPQEVLHLLLQQQQHQAQAAQAAAVQQAQAAAAHQQQQQQQAQQQAMAALATAMGLGVNPAAMQHNNNLMLDMLRNVGQIPGLAAHFNAAAHTPRS